MTYLKKVMNYLKKVIPETRRGTKLDIYVLLATCRSQLFSLDTN